MDDLIPIPYAIVDGENYYGEPPDISQDSLDKQIVENPERYKCYHTYVESISEESDWDDDRSVYQAHKADYDITERIEMTINDHIEVLKQMVQAGEYRLDHHNSSGKTLTAADVTVIEISSDEDEQSGWYAGMVKTPTDPFKKGMEQLRCKGITPLMAIEDVEFARGLLQLARINGPYHLGKAKDTYIERSAEGLLCFIIARYNQATPNDIRAILGQFLPPNDVEFNRQFAKLTRQVNDARNETLKFFKGAVKSIVDAFNLAAGCNIFETLTEAQREEVFNAVFNQYPLWTTLKFQPKAQRAVDFPQIFAYQSSDRTDFRDFYHSMFIHMCEATHSIVYRCKLQDRAATNSLKKHWEHFPTRNFVQQMGLGDELDLPCVTKDAGKAQYKKVAPADDGFYSGDEEVEDDNGYDGEW